MHRWLHSIEGSPVLPCSYRTHTVERVDVTAVRRVGVAGVVRTTFPLAMRLTGLYAFRTSTGGASGGAVREGQAKPGTCIRGSVAK
jgi:hypothetical protein